MTKVFDAVERQLRNCLPGGKFVGLSAARSRLMRAVRGKGNKSTEGRLRAALARAGIRGWVVEPRGVLGSPDFLFPDEQIAVFVDGCFWHGCQRCGHVPKSNSRFWRAKIRRNQERDRFYSSALRRRGYRVLRFWEHHLSDLEFCLSKIQRSLGSARRKGV